MRQTLIEAQAFITKAFISKLFEARVLLALTDLSELPPHTPPLLIYFFIFHSFFGLGIISKRKLNKKFERKSM